MEKRLIQITWVEYTPYDLSGELDELIAFLESLKSIGATHLEYDIDFRGDTYTFHPARYETDEEYNIRLQKEISARQKRYEDYLRLKEEFEGEIELFGKGLG